MGYIYQITVVPVDICHILKLIDHIGVISEICDTYYYGIGSKLYYLSYSKQNHLEQLCPTFVGVGAPFQSLDY